MKTLFAFKSFFACLLLVLSGLLISRPARAADPQWTLVWNDEFSGSAGAPPDPTRWTYDLGGGGWGNGELETYTSATANVYQDGNGHLVIQAEDNAGNYTSARIKTTGLFDQAYGLVEASIELPAGTAEGSGLWPAFWMLGQNLGTVGWPECGEIDIMENIGQYNTAAQNGGHIHGPILIPGDPDYNNGDGVGTTYAFPAGEAMNTAYHLYAVEWNPTSISFLVDGVVYQILTAASLPNDGSWVFNHPFFIIMNLAMGGPVGGTVTAALPQQLLVDYVRVYKFTDNGTTAYGGTAVSLPGTVPCANYDSYDDSTDPTEPGEGFAYNALNTAQTNGVYRTGDAISTEACDDTDGGYDCDYTSPGQWLQYTVNVTQSGTYTVAARVASDGQGGTFHLDVDGVTATAELTCPNTGGWQDWQSVTADITLTAGSHVLLLDEDTMGTSDLGVCNFHELNFSLDTNTPTQSPTSTPTPTRSVTPSFTLTATPSLTPSPSASPTVSLSASLSPTRSVTPIFTLTTTVSPTPSLDASPSVSLTASPTSLSGTPTHTPTVTPSFTLSPTLTLTPSLTPSPSLTLTATPSRTPSSTPTLTVTPSVTPSPTPTLTVTPSFASSPTPPLTVTPSLTPSPSASRTTSLTASPTPTLSETVTVTPPAGATATRSPIASDEPLKILKGVFVPQPLTGLQGTLYVLLQGSANQVEVRLYTRAFVQIVALQLPGSWVQGWNSQRFTLPPLPNGIYFAVVTAFQSGNKSRLGKPVPLMVLR